MSLPIFDGKISIITATYNAEKYLPRLIESLRKQEDKNFEWVIADGASTDKTLELLNAVDDLNIKITSQEDFGIYDALNRGIKACHGEFYLVMGADDVLYPNGIKDYKAAISDDVDAITAPVYMGNKLSLPKHKLLFLYRQFYYVSAHAVGTVFRKSLHEKNGYYSRRFPIAADQLFIMRVFGSGAKLRKLDNDVVVGMHDIVGVSKLDYLGTSTERYRVMIELNFNVFFQTVLFILVLIKNVTFRLPSRELK